MNNLFKLIYHKTVRNKKKWLPFLSVFYLTYDCNFRCFFCSDGTGRPYYTLPKDIPEPDKAIEIASRIRKYTDVIVITGGEPLIYPEIDYYITNIKKLHFKQVILTTRGMEFEDHASSLASSVTTLVFSLDTLGTEKADNFYGVPANHVEKIISNIDSALAIRNRKFKVEISAVVTPGNINDLYKVYEFAAVRNIEFAACPQLVGVKAHQLLESNKEYMDFYNFLINEKKKGRKIFGTSLYLRHMRDLSQFRCHPFTMLVVSPTGGIFYPCLEIGHNAGNILETDDISKALLSAREKYGPQPACGNQCQSACALSFSLLVNQTLRSIAGSKSNYFV